MGERNKETAKGEDNAQGPNEGESEKLKVNTFMGRCAHVLYYVSLCLTVEFFVTGRTSVVSKYVAAVSLLGATAPGVSACVCGLHCGGTLHHKSSSVYVCHNLLRSWYL